MLVQFTVQNFKSIKKAATLDLQATAFSEHKNTLLRSPAGDLLLPLSVIYGPNGGGKSNVLEAIGALVRKVVVPIYMATYTVGSMPGYPSAPIMPFVFDPHTKNEPTKFDFFSKPVSLSIDTASMPRKKKWFMNVWIGSNSARKSNQAFLKGTAMG